MGEAPGRVSAVCIVTELVAERSNPDGLTAISKGPVSQRVPVSPYGLSGDLVKDYKHHGGLEQAVYVYTDQDAARWAAELGVELPPGAFGENLRVDGVEVTHAEIGQRWRIGSDGLEVVLTSPRIPCATFARHMARRGVPQRGWVKRFTEYGAPGGYFAVTSPGTVGSGDEITALEPPGHGVTLGEMFRGGPTISRRLLAAHEDGRIRLGAKVLGSIT